VITGSQWKEAWGVRGVKGECIFFFFSLLLSSLELSDAKSMSLEHEPSSQGEVCVPTRSAGLTSGGVRAVSVARGYVSEGAHTFSRSLSLSLSLSSLSLSLALSPLSLKHLSR